MAEIQGEYDERFAAVAQALGDALEAGDAGGSAAVFVAGEPVVDVWGGYADAGGSRGWKRDTIVNVFSVTKTMTALCALILVDRGLLDPDAPVARYWPEFAAAGKETVLVRQCWRTPRDCRTGRVRLSSSTTGQRRPAGSRRALHRPKAGSLIEGRPLSR